MVKSLPFHGLCLESMRWASGKQSGVSGRAVMLGLYSRAVYPEGCVGMDCVEGRGGGEATGRLFRLSR